MTEQLTLDSDPPASEEALIEEINAMPYEQMLRRVRNADLGDAMFRGKAGEVFHVQMKQKRHALPPDVRVEISKRVGY